MTRTPEEVLAHWDEGFQDGSKAWSLAKALREALRQRDKKAGQMVDWIRHQEAFEARFNEVKAERDQLRAERAALIEVSKAANYAAEHGDGISLKIDRALSHPLVQSALKETK